MWGFWPEAEDRALRGRNLSAVFRTLYRQVGEPCQRLPSCAQVWRVEKQCDKSTFAIVRRLRIGRGAAQWFSEFSHGLIGTSSGTTKKRRKSFPGLFPFCEALGKTGADFLGMFPLGRTTAPELRFSLLFVRVLKGTATV